MRTSIKVLRLMLMRDDRPRTYIYTHTRAAQRRLFLPTSDVCAFFELARKGPFRRASLAFIHNNISYNVGSAAPPPPRSTRRPLYSLFPAALLFFLIEIARCDYIYTAAGETRRYVGQGAKLNGLSYIILSSSISSSREMTRGCSKLLCWR